MSKSLTSKTLLNKLPTTAGPSALPYSYTAGYATGTVGGASRLVLDIRELGAVCDGIADDGAAINAALYTKWSGLAVLQKQDFIEYHARPGDVLKFTTPVTIRQQHIRLIGNGARINCTGAYAFDITQDASGNGNEKGAILAWDIRGATTAAIRGRASSFWDISYNTLIGNAIGIDFVAVEAMLTYNYVRDNTGTGILVQSAVLVGGSIGESQRCQLIGNLSWVNGGYGIHLIDGGGHILNHNDLEANRLGDLRVQSSFGNQIPFVYLEAALAQAGAASISGTTLNITSIPSPGSPWAIGMHVIGAGVADNTTIIGFGTGTGSTGTYTVSTSQTVASTSMVGKTPFGIQIDNTVGLVGAARTSEGNQFLGGTIGGGYKWDVDVVGGNNNVFGCLRPGDAQFRVGAVGCTNTVLLPMAGEFTVTNNGNNTLNMQRLDRYWTGVKPSSSTDVPLRNIGGFVDFATGDTSKTVTLGTAEADANYRVNLTAATISGVPSAGSKRVSLSALPSTSGFTVVNEAAPGGGASVRVYYELMR
jgi:hypothetical protein